MGYDDAILSDFNDPLCNFIKFRSRTQHSIIDPGKFYNKRLNWYFGINKADKLIDNFMSIKFIDGNFRYSFFVKLPSGCLYV